MESISCCWEEEKAQKPTEHVNGTAKKEKAKRNSIRDEWSRLRTSQTAWHTFRASVFLRKSKGKG
jgi:hypothetical protein